MNIMRQLAACVALSAAICINVLAKNDNQMSTEHPSIEEVVNRLATCLKKCGSDTESAEKIAREIITAGMNLHAAQDQQKSFSLSASLQQAIRPALKCGVGAFMFYAILRKLDPAIRDVFYNKAEYRMSEYYKIVSLCINGISAALAYYTAALTVDTLPDYVASKKERIKELVLHALSSVMMI